MLQIKDIRKQYITGDLVQTALDGVSLTLRDNEFVAILGPSGSGKTTMLNVIGGLDRYDSGDLIINGISTRKYTDRDWDSYRNHTIGFVFQSYNLIPHQTVLANVELALTISGISRAERRKRATKALEDVGLGDQLHKRPNQMSGGQMQRVAIARALVNNPDILLADEPTGALDSETSVQIMELLKEVARDRLVVMVTHNPELAEEYANRIVRVKDGRIIGDTNPYEVSEEEIAPPQHKNMGKSSMSIWTALSLSFNNLRTKKARTLLTAFAGSIGIIGIALIMSLSTGFQLYIDQIQEDTLSNYPLSIQTETADMTAALTAYGGSLAQAQAAEEGVVVEQQMISQMFAQIGSNDLASFKAYLDEHYDEVAHTINAIHYDYSVSPLIFDANTQERILQVNPGVLFGDLMGNSAMSAYMDMDIFQEIIDSPEMLDAQYQVLEGRWPEASNEIVIILSDPHQLTDYTAYTLGLKDASVLNEMMAALMRGEEIDTEAVSVPLEWNYDDLMALDFRVVPASQLYRYNEEYQVWEDMSTDSEYMRQIIAEGLELEVVGIVCPREGVSATVLTEGVGYTHELTAYVIDCAADSQIVQDQLANPDVDVFTGVPFGSEQEQGLNFENMITVDEDKLNNAFGMNISTDALMQLLSDYMLGAGDVIAQDTKPAQDALLNTFRDMNLEMLSGYIAANANENGAAVLRLEDVESLVSSYLAGDSAQAKLNALVSSYGLTVDEYAQLFKPLMVATLTEYISQNISVDTAEETVPEESVPEDTTTEETEPEQTPSEGTESETPDVEIPEVDLSQFYVEITQADAAAMAESFAQNEVVTGSCSLMASKMMADVVEESLNQYLQGFGNVIGYYMGSSFYVDADMLASAFQFNMSEEELQRLMMAMSGNSQQASQDGNLKMLGYADLDVPYAISIYLIDFAGKEEFLNFLDNYNAEMEAAGMEDQVIRYTDLTGIMMSSVRTIIDSVSYVLIAFVAVSLIVSSIMIGIITYISVMERTKEIGVLRAIGASKRNISQVFNAETFIIGLCSGLIGVGLTLLLNIPINMIIHHLTGNLAINAQLPVANGVVLIILSMVLTLIGGLIPSSKAAKKDPVIALRSE